MTDAAAQGAHRARYRRILSFAAREFIKIWWFELVLPRFGMSTIAERTRAPRMQRERTHGNRTGVDLVGIAHSTVDDDRRPTVARRGLCEVSAKNCAANAAAAIDHQYPPLTGRFHGIRQ